MTYLSLVTVSPLPPRSWDLCSIIICDRELPGSLYRDGAPDGLIVSEVPSVDVKALQLTLTARSAFEELGDGVPGFMNLMVAFLYLGVR